MQYAALVDKQKLNMLISILMDYSCYFWIKLYLYAGFGGHEGFGCESALFAFGGCDLPSEFADVAQPKEVIRGRQDCLERYIVR